MNQSASTVIERSHIIFSLNAWHPKWFSSARVRFSFWFHRYRFIRYFQFGQAFHFVAWDSNTNPARFKTQRLCVCVYQTLKCIISKWTAEKHAFSLITTNWRRKKKLFRLNMRNVPWQVLASLWTHQQQTIPMFSTTFQFRRSIQPNCLHSDSEWNWSQIRSSCCLRSVQWAFNDSAGIQAVRLGVTIQNWTNLLYIMLSLCFTIPITEYKNVLNRNGIQRFVGCLIRHANHVLTGFCISSKSILIALRHSG